MSYILDCAAVKGRVFKHFALRKGIEIKEVWSKSGAMCRQTDQSDE